MYSTNTGCSDTGWPDWRHLLGPDRDTLHAIPVAEEQEVNVLGPRAGVLRVVAAAGRCVFVFATHPY